VALHCPCNCQTVLAWLLVPCDCLLFKETVFICRLYDVLHSEKKLTLVFEYCDQDLKKYFDSCNGEIDPDVVKVVCMARLLLWAHSL